MTYQYGCEVQLGNTQTKTFNEKFLTPSPHHGDQNVQSEKYKVRTTSRSLVYRFLCNDTNRKV